MVSPYFAPRFFSQAIPSRGCPIFFPQVFPQFLRLVSSPRFKGGRGVLPLAPIGTGEVDHRAEPGDPGRDVKQMGMFGDVCKRPLK